MRRYQIIFDESESSCWTLDPIQSEPYDGSCLDLEAYEYSQEVDPEDYEYLSLNLR